MPDDPKNPDAAETPAADTDADTQADTAGEAVESATVEIHRESTVEDKALSGPRDSDK